MSAWCYVRRAWSSCSLILTQQGHGHEMPRQLTELCPQYSILNVIGETETWSQHWGTFPGPPVIMSLSGARSEQPPDAGPPWKQVLAQGWVCKLKSDGWEASPTEC